VRPDRPPERIGPFLQELQETWELYPDFRFGQLIINIAETGVANMYHLEEESWLHLIRKYRKTLQAALEKQEEDRNAVERP